jgi:hypothetical protein
MVSAVEASSVDTQYHNCLRHSVLAGSRICVVPLRGSLSESDREHQWGRPNSSVRALLNAAELMA